MFFEFSSEESRSKFSMAKHMDDDLLEELRALAQERNRHGKLLMPMTVGTVWSSRGLVVTSV